MRILRKLIILIIVLSIISSFANGKTIKAHEQVNEESEADVIPAITIKPTTKPSTVSEDTDSTQPIIPSTSTTGNSKVINPPNHQTVAPNDVPTFKPTNTKSPEYQPLTSLPPTQPPPKSAAPTTTMPPKGGYQPPPQIPTKAPTSPITPAPTTQAPEEEETEAPTSKPSKTKAPKPTEAPSEEEETETPTSDLSSFSLETDKPTQTPKPPKTTPPSNLIPTFSESSFDLGMDSSNSESSNSNQISSNQFVIFSTLILLVLNTLL